MQDERELLLQHAPAALAGLSAPVRGAIVRARLCELWWRGLSRHTDYGRPSSSYLRPEDVVPGAVMPAVLRMASRSTVQRLLRAAAAGRRASFRLPGGARSQEPASSQAVSGHRAFDVAEPVR